VSPIYSDEELEAMSAEHDSGYSYCPNTVHLTLCGHDHPDCGNYRPPRNPATGKPISCPGDVPEGTQARLAAIPADQPWSQSDYEGPDWYGTPDAH